MKIVISAKQPLLDGQVDERFGRCEYFVMVDSENQAIETFTNPGASQSGGAGVAAAQFVIDKNAKAVVSGAFGPNASRAFRAAGIDMFLFTSDTVTVKQAFEKLKQEKLPKNKS